MVVIGINVIIIYVLVQQYFGVNIQGIFYVRLDFEFGGVILFYMYLLVFEIIFVVEGLVFIGFVSYDNKLFIKMLYKGDVFLFLRVMLYFQFCVGNVFVIMFNFFNVQFLGFLMVVNQLFVINMNYDVLVKFFGFNEVVMNVVNVLIFCFWG